MSTSDQNAQLQIDELREAGCNRILVETAPGTGERPELAHLLDLLRPDDTVVVWRLDRLGRSLKGLIERVDELQDRGVALRSLRETIDTSSAGAVSFFTYSPPWPSSSETSCECEQPRDSPRRGLGEKSVNDLDSCPLIKNRSRGTLINKAA